MKLFLRYEDASSLPQLTYVLRILDEHPLCPSELSLNPIASATFVDRGMQVFYGSPAHALPGEWVIPAQSVFFSKPDNKQDNLVSNAYQWKDQHLYSVEQGPTRRQKAFLVDRRFGFDLLETIFFHLSRWEEVFAAQEEMDEWDMLRSEHHFLVRNGLHHRPVVDHIISAFFESLGFSVGISPTPLILTHDVDVLLKFPSFYTYLRAAGRLIIEGRISQLYELTRSYLATRIGSAPDPFDTFHWLLSDKKEMEKIIYFLAGGSTRFDHYVQIGHPYAEEVIGLAKRKGYQIGLHPSYASWKEALRFKEELTRLEQLHKKNIRQSRQHFLHFSFFETPDILEKLGIEQDSSLGYQDRIGFRCGTGFPFRFYDLPKERICTFQELPMIIMDSAILEEADRAQTTPEIFLKKFLEQNERNTQLTVNFHNSSFDNIRWDSEMMKRLYQMILNWRIEPPCS